MVKHADKETKKRTYCTICYFRKLTVDTKVRTECINKQNTGTKIDEKTVVANRSKKK